MTKMKQFSTEIRSAFGSDYIKVFFLDDSEVTTAKGVLDNLNCIKRVNITRSESQEHSGKTLTIYPKSMVTAQICQQEIDSNLDKFFTNTFVGSMNEHNEAYFVGIETRLLAVLDGAKAMIDVCVAWFTNDKLLQKLVEKQSNGVAVRVIIYRDGVNIKYGVDLSKIPHKEIRGERGGIMHEKFCVIDNITTINGSYNWTLNAENKNDEDAAFHINDVAFASEYTRRFNELWGRG